MLARRVAARPGGARLVWVAANGRREKMGRLKRDCAACPRGAAAQPRIPKNRRSDPGGVGSLACTRTDCHFISRSVCQRRLTSGRHGLTSASLSQFPEGTRCHSVFVLVAFPPPPVYVLDNEAQPKLSGVRYSEVDHSSRAPSRFYPHGPDESADPSCASLSASAGASLAEALTASFCPQASRHRNACRSPRRSRFP
jgi:hypothetical protein